MSKTIVDMPKVTQMIDAGWRVKLFRGGLGSYVAIAAHDSIALVDRLRTKPGIVDDDGSDEITTDDFTPEQALTRLAYKVHGEIIDS